MSRPVRRLVIVLLAVGIASGAATAGAQNGSPERGTARGDTSSFWLSEEASADSLDAFWSNLQQEWRADLPENMVDFGLEEFQVDSLLAIGEIKLQQLVAGTLWRSNFELIRLPEFNRVQGPVGRVAWSLAKVGPNRPVFRIQGGYAFANQRPVAEAALDLPLKRRRWELDNGRGQGREYQLLALRLTARKDVVRFAGDDRRATRTLSALIYGADPNHYFEERRADARLTARLTRGTSAWLSAGYSQERRLSQEMDWNLLGRDLSPDGNRMADGLNAKRLTGGTEGTFGPLSLQAETAWWRAEDSDFMDRLSGIGTDLPGQGGADYLRLSVAAELDYLDGLGNQWLLRGSHRRQDKPAPRQWRYWLGDFNENQGMLRGYQAGELSGEIASSASVDLRLNFDLWRTLHVPLLGRLNMQPILFGDWGHTRNRNWMGKTYDDVASADPLAADLGDGAQGWRADAGFGFAVPGLAPVSHMRIYAARAVGQGSGDADWRVLFAFER